MPHWTLPLDTRGGHTIEKNAQLVAFDRSERKLADLSKCGYPLTLVLLRSIP